MEAIVAVAVVVALSAALVLALCLPKQTTRSVNDNSSQAASAYAAPALTEVVVHGNGSAASYATQSGASNPPVAAAAEVGQQAKRGRKPKADAASTTVPARATSAAGHGGPGRPAAGAPPMLFPTSPSSATAGSGARAGSLGPTSPSSSLSPTARSDAGSPGLAVRWVPPGKHHSKRKETVVTRIQGAPLREVESVLTKLVRDSNVSKRRDKVAAQHREGAYYLRPRKGRGEGETPDVEHTWECRMLGHTIVQSPEVAVGGFLASVELNEETPLSEQHGVLSFLKPLYDVQNCVGDESLFNLRLMERNLNVKKTHIVRRWIELRYAHCTDPTRVPKVNLMDSFRPTYTGAIREGQVLTGEEVEELVGSLQRELKGVEEPYVNRLDDRAARLGRDNADRVRGVVETFKCLQEELE